MYAGRFGIDTPPSGMRIRLLRESLFPPTRKSASPQEKQKGRTMYCGEHLDADATCYQHGCAYVPVELVETVPLSQANHHKPHAISTFLSFAGQKPRPFPQIVPSSAKSPAISTFLLRIFISDRQKVPNLRYGMIRNFSVHSNTVTTNLKSFSVPPSCPPCYL